MLFFIQKHFYRLKAKLLGKSFYTIPTTYISQLVDKSTYRRDFIKREEEKFKKFEGLLHDSSFMKSPHRYMYDRDAYKVSRK